MTKFMHNLLLVLTFIVGTGIEVQAASKTQESSRDSLMLTPNFPHQAN